MNKTLTYIDDEIKMLNSYIEQCKELRIHYKKLFERTGDPLNIPPEETYKESIEFAEKKIKRLQECKDEILDQNKDHTLEQVKCELEAWEICKKKLNLKVQTEEAVTEGFCMKGYWLLVEQYPYTQTTIIEQEEYEILKKSLEVKENG